MKKLGTSIFDKQHRYQSPAATLECQHRDQNIYSGPLLDDERETEEIFVNYSSRLDFPIDRF